jgi:hypothetical protein
MLQCPLRDTVRTWGLAEFKAPDVFLNVFGPAFGRCDLLVQQGPFLERDIERDRGERERDL